jgi:hypothetical protein
MKGLERSAAARGGLLSGATLKGIQRFGQDLGSQEYQNAFNRYQTERQARLNPLQSLAGVGQTTSQQLGAAGTQMAGNVGNLMTSGAAARASGYVGGANALTGALNTGLKDFGGISGAVGQGTNAIGGLIQQLIGGLAPKPGQDFLGQAGAQVGGNFSSMPGMNFGAQAPTIDPNNSLVPAGFLGGGGSDLTSLLGGLGLGAQSSEQDFWAAIGLDPATLSFVTDPVEAGTTDLSSQDWFTGEGWNTLDWGSP